MRWRSGKDRKPALPTKYLEETTMNPIRIAKNWLSYRRTFAELSNLPSHTLADIGLTRYDIRTVAARRAF